jgi:hypothetical protein
MFEINIMMVQTQSAYQQNSFVMALHGSFSYLSYVYFLLVAVVVVYYCVRA